MRKIGAQLYGPRDSNFLSHRIVTYLFSRIYGKCKFQCIGNSSSGTAKTKMTSMVAPRRVREKAEAVVPQLYEQDKLSERCGQSFSTLSEAISVSLAAGFIDAIESKRLQGVRKKENVAKHENFRHRSQQQ